MTLVMSDIHGNLEALSAVLRDAEQYGRIEQIIILGDIIDYGADSVGVINTLYSLMDKGCKITCLKGNHEEAFYNYDTSLSSMIKTPHGQLSMSITRRLLEESPDATDKLSQILETSNCKPEFELHDGFRPLILAHGTLDNPLRGVKERLHTYRQNSCSSDKISSITNRLYSDNCEVTSVLFAPTHLLGSSVVLGGHTHLQGWYAENNSIYLNPGSVGQPRNGDPRAHYLILNITMMRFMKVPYDIDTAASKIVDAGYPKFLATRLYLGI